jgi:hypothetical protein
MAQSQTDQRMREATVARFEPIEGILLEGLAAP